MIEVAVIFAAGVAAGGINTVVGAGTLITFPVLLAFGYSPIVANVSNAVGMIPGGVSGTWGYRRELAGQRRALTRLGPWSLMGAVCGASLLLVLSPEVFKAVVPVLLVASVLAVLLQRPGDPGHLAGRANSHAARRRRACLTIALVFGAGIYGGYFGAAQGVILMATLTLLLDETLQRVNALKNALSLIVNCVAAATFLVISPGHIDAAVVGLIAIGSLCGGFLGARIGRVLSPTVLRALIVIVGVAGVWQIAVMQ